MDKTMSKSKDQLTSKDINEQVRTETGQIDSTQTGKKDSGSSSTQDVNQTKDRSKSQIRGDLTFDDQVIQKIVGIALDKVDGLLSVDGGFFSNITSKLVNTDQTTSGIDVEVGKKQVAVDLEIVAEYQKRIPEIYDKMKDIIQREVHQMTNLDVVELNVNVVDVMTREEHEKQSDTVQDKLSRATEKTGEFISDKTSQATDATKRAVNKSKNRVDQMRENNEEPRVE